MILKLTNNSVDGGKNVHIIFKKFAMHYWYFTECASQGEVEKCMQINKMFWKSVYSRTCFERSLICVTLCLLQDVFLGFSSFFFLMTLVLKLDLDMVKMCHHTKNEVSM